MTIKKGAKIIATDVATAANGMYADIIATAGLSGSIPRKGQPFDAFGDLGFGSQSPICALAFNAIGNPKRPTTTQTIGEYNYSYIPATSDSIVDYEIPGAAVTAPNVWAQEIAAADFVHDGSDNSEAKARALIGTPGLPTGSIVTRYPAGPPMYGFTFLTYYFNVDGEPSTPFNIANGNLTFSGSVSVSFSNGSAGATLTGSFARNSDGTDTWSIAASPTGTDINGNSIMLRSDTPSPVTNAAPGPAPVFVFIDSVNSSVIGSIFTANFSTAGEFGLRSPGATMVSWSGAH